MTDLASLTPEDWARRFHEAYERLAPEYGYVTREESAVPWPDVPEQNRLLMAAVAQEVVGPLAAALEAAEKERDEVVAWAEQMEACDCVPLVISSRACPKCGRRGVAQEGVLAQFMAAEARVTQLEAAADRFVNWNEPRIVPTEEIPDQDAALRVLRRVLAGDTETPT